MLIVSSAINPKTVPPINCANFFNLIHFMGCLYLYLIFITRIVIANVSVIISAAIIGISLIAIPYMSQRNTPNVKIEYIANDRSFVCLVLMTLIACGRKEKVVHVAAANPITVNEVMCFRFNLFCVGMIADLIDLTKFMRVISMAY